jgi:hypothetical protein
MKNGVQQAMKVPVMIAKVRQAFRSLLVSTDSFLTPRFFFLPLNGRGNASSWRDAGLPLPFEGPSNSVSATSPKQHSASSVLVICSWVRSSSSRSSSGDKGAAMLVWTLSDFT